MKAIKMAIDDIVQKFRQKAKSKLDSTVQKLKDNASDISQYVKDKTKSALITAGYLALTGSALAAFNATEQKAFADPTMTVNSSASIGNYDFDLINPGNEQEIQYGVKNTSEQNTDNDMSRFEVPAGSNDGVFLTDGPAGWSASIGSNSTTWTSGGALTPGNNALFTLYSSLLTTGEGEATAQSIEEVPFNSVTVDIPIEELITPNPSWTVSDIFSIGEHDASWPGLEYEGIITASNTSPDNGLNNLSQIVIGAGSNQDIYNIDAPGWSASIGSDSTTLTGGTLSPNNSLDIRVYSHNTGTSTTTINGQTPTSESFGSVSITSPNTGTPVPPTQLSVSSSTGGSVSTPGEGSFDYAHGTDVPVVAEAQTNYHFVDWTGSAVSAGKMANAASASTTVTMDGDYALVANFALDQYSLTVASDGHGSVAGAGTFDWGSVVPITATANANYRFTGWTSTGSVSVTDAGSASTTVTISGAGTVTANFALVEYAVIVNSTGHGHTDQDGSHTIHHGDTLTIYPFADNGYGFSAWSGDASGTDEPLTVTVTSDMIITANFEDNRSFMVVYIACV